MRNAESPPRRKLVTAATTEYNAAVDPADPNPTAPQTALPVQLSYATGMPAIAPIPIWLSLLLVPAVVGCCLPFAYSESPLTVAWAILEHPADIARSGERVLAFLAYGLWMCLPLTVMSLLPGRFPKACRPAATTCVALAGVAIALNGWVLVVLCLESLSRPWEAMVTAVFGILLLAGCGMVIRCLVRIRPMAILAMIMLLTAYVPMAVLCLCMFSDTRPGAGYVIILCDLPAYGWLTVIVLRR